MIRNRPKAKDTALRVRLLDNRAQLLFFFKRHLPFAPPLKMTPPSIADHRHQVNRQIAVQVGESPIQSREALLVSRNGFKRTITTDDHVHCFLNPLTVSSYREDLRILTEELIQDLVSYEAIFLKIEKEGHHGTVSVNPPSVLPNPFTEGV